MLEVLWIESHFIDKNTCTEPEENLEIFIPQYNHPHPQTELGADLHLLFLHQ